MDRRLGVGFVVALVFFVGAFMLFGRSRSKPVPPPSDPVATSTRAVGGPRARLIPPSEVEPDAPPTPEPEVPDDPGSHRPPKFDYKAPATNGLYTRELTPDDRERYKIPEKLNGVVITDVDPRSAAAEAALITGDVIVRANFDWLGPDKKLEELVGDRVFTALTIYRNGQPIEMVLNKPFDPETSPKAPKLPPPPTPIVP